MSDKTGSERRLVIVSNRLPFNVTVSEGRLRFHESAGGLVTGLSAYIESRRRAGRLSDNHVWVGWPGSSVEGQLQEELRSEALLRFQSYPVFLSAEEMDQFYLGFCNATIWPLFHYFPSYTVYQPRFWDQYKRVNEVFCESLMNVVRPDDLVWIHDYHLMLLPRMLKKKAPDLPVGFFLHIPFPSFEVFRLLPGTWRREILEGLLGADLIGLHTYEYAQHFFQSALRILGFENQMGRILTPEGIVKVDTFPMGIDFDKFANAIGRADVQGEIQHSRHRLSHVKIILSVDRLDYSKGILNRLEGFELFLEANPRYHGVVVLAMVVVPSRIGVHHYDQMKKQIEELVGKINGRFGRIDWTPVVYQYRNVPFEALAALYSASDICLVTPLRDGMNLVAKEYVATRTDGTGVLILSEMTGAAKELGEAIIVNPNNRQAIADALSEALEMPANEQKRRNRMMQARLRRYDVMRWAGDFVSALVSVQEVRDKVRAKLLPYAARSDLIEHYRQSRRRVLFLDYDGTLTPLARHPALVKPNETQMDLLCSLTADPRNTVVIISGRDRSTLDKWFGDLSVGLVAEHGAWLKGVGKPWRLSKSMTSEWKGQLLPILESYADRLPGAFVEEKEHSVAWHYRSADPDQAALLAAEMTDHLANLTAKADLQVSQGNRVVEIRHAGVNKGTAARDWIANADFDFVLAIGDDLTDEELFRVLPESAMSIRVGLVSTHARYNLRVPAEVLELLNALAQLPDEATKSGKC
ncbi:MAG: bifunctional alpha,alpha-trehalose-phosphate synthase (UDP-forming)/trehalose-phosphatase [Deltaproteobacteria bacterium RIFCSPLOWO2_12_FULL_60_19]|nr:MAG: bifunctional alpha,alpha-trehalose-phosphate synthase (UDP-forming)/trehalose-phosphatase [Deltaproteobacteria bacterium RIFCSPLOWO2_12_FULL_60_19]